MEASLSRPGNRPVETWNRVCILSVACLYPTEVSVSYSIPLCVETWIASIHDPIRLLYHSYLWWLSNKLLLNSLARIRLIGGPCPEGPTVPTFCIIKLEILFFVSVLVCISILRIEPGYTSMRYKPIQEQTCCHTERTEPCDADSVIHYPNTYRYRGAAESRL